MSNLHVTDVQAALRHFASTGHDVLTDPRGLHVDGKKFKMAAAHRLYIPRHGFETFGNTLTSTLMQSEQPHISEFVTNSRSKGSGIQELQRNVKHYTPARTTQVADEDSDVPSDSYLHAEYKNPLKPFGFHAESSTAPEGTTLWTPEDNFVHSSSAEALESHPTHPDIDRTGRVYDVGSVTKHRPMAPEDQFDHSSALSDLIHPAKPFDGFITVATSTRHHGPLDYYSYNPDTEQLFKHEG